MKLRSIALAALLGCSSLVLAQGTTPQTPPAGTDTQSSAGSAQSTAPGTRGAMHAQHMAAFKQQVTKMQALLDQMKSNVGSMSGASKTAMEANVQLWQMMIDHMNQMADQMSMMGGGMGMRPHHGMGAGPGRAPNLAPGQTETGTPGNSNKPPQGDQTNNPPTPPQR
jgi:TolA-binding protein